MNGAPDLATNGADFWLANMTGIVKVSVAMTYVNVVLLGLAYRHPSIYIKTGFIRLDVCFGSKTASQAHSSSAAAFGKSGQFQSGKFNENEWLLSAKTGHLGKQDSTD